MKAITIAAKETTELLRDFKTVVVAILVPLVLFPLTFALVHAVEQGGGNRVIRVSAEGVSTELRTILETSERIEVETVSGEEGELKLLAGESDLVVLSRETENAAPAVLYLVFDSSRRRSVEARGLVTSLIDLYEAQRRTRKLAAAGYSPQATVELEDAGPGVSIALTATLAPLLLLVACALSPLPSAADLGAGEKERATLAPLLATGVSRGSILAGKLVAVSILGMIGATAFVLGALLSHWIMPDLLGGASLALEGGGSLLRIVFHAILLTVLFSSVELTISLFADSPKEAQTYLIPIIMISLAVGYLATTVELATLPPIAWGIPLFGSALSVRSAALGAGSFHTGAVSSASTMISIVLCAAAGRRVLESERILLR